ncbi:hypothetical protein E2C01_050495 [Portunus trituberculatus]|uniref:Uncharacterized protein n=1 Tax=Portunus trituberculatus TaxID=210409 RepID=A0A5B7GGN5_PORTR|nr:hypothetical protein [Portunus trituberculatus]
MPSNKVQYLIVDDFEQRWIARLKMRTGIWYTGIPKKKKIKEASKEAQSENELDCYITTSETVEDNDSEEEEDQDGMEKNGTCKRMAKKTEENEEVENGQGEKVEKKNPDPSKENSEAKTQQSVEETTQLDHTYAGKTDKGKEKVKERKEKTDQKKPIATNQEPEKEKRSRVDSKTNETITSQKNNEEDAPYQDGENSAKSEATT